MFAHPVQEVNRGSRRRADGQAVRDRPAIIVGRRDDPAERDADLAAHAVTQAGAFVPAGRPSGASGDAVRESGERAPAIVEQVLDQPGRPLDTQSRAYFEPRFGRDFSSVRVHDDGNAASSARAVHALAYTVGNHIVVGHGRPSPGPRHVMAHELAHVSQEPAGAAPLLRRLPDDAGLVDAGVPEITPARDLTDTEIYQEYYEAAGSGQIDRAATLDEEMARRLEDWGTALPRGPQPVVGGAGAITPEVALKLLDNMSRGEMPFKPSEGRGGSSWFTTEGDPYTSVTANKSVNVQVEVAKGANPLVFNEASLVQIFQSEMASAMATAEAQYRAKFNVPDGIPLSNRAVKAVKWNAARLAEGQMWTRIGKMVAESASRVGEVILEPGSIFSKTPGKFAVVADAAKVTLKGGVGPLVDTLAAQGVGAEPTVVQAAEQLASKMKWVGRVKTAFHYGGRILIVLAVATDVVVIYRAENRKKAVVTVAGGWAGAAAAGAAFAAWFAPADAAGPWAWAAHGVGTLVAGGVGYWLGSETTRVIYELVAE